VNHDGKLDVVTANAGSSSVSVLLGGGTGGFNLGTPVFGFSPVAVALADLDDARVVDEDTSLVFGAAHGNAITLSDIDANGGTESLTLNVLHGALTLATEANLSVTGDGTGAVALSGTVADIDAALDGLAYLPAANYFGADTLTVTADDNGNSGSGGPLPPPKLVPSLRPPGAEPPAAG